MTMADRKGNDMQLWVGGNGWMVRWSCDHYVTLIINMMRRVRSYKNTKSSTTAPVVKSLDDFAAAGGGWLCVTTYPIHQVVNEC